MSELTSARVLVFRVGGVRCAIHAQAVREIMAMQPATRVPGAAEEVSGVINMRGTVVTVVDLRLCLDQPAGESDGSLVMIYVHGRTVGLVVDEVLDLGTLPEGALAAREGLPGIEARFVQAVGRHDGRLFALLDTEMLLHEILPSQEGL